MATINDVAKKAGVSIATVSYVLNGRTDLVRQETAERIMVAAKELNYSASPMARGLATGSSYTVAVVLPHHYVFSHPIGSQEFLGVAEEFYLSNYAMLIKPSYEDERRMHHPHRGIPKHVAGVLVLGPMNLDNPDLQEARELNKPMVVVEDLPDEWGIISVNADNFAAARIVAEHMVKKGHRIIGLLVESKVSACMDRRIAGCRSVFAENGIELDSSLIADVDSPQVEVVSEAAGKLLDSPTSPTAVIALSSALMPGISKAVSARGLSVPDQLAVGCVDYGMPSDFKLEWPVVTLAHDLRHQGEIAARTLIEMLKSKDAKPENRYIIPELSILQP